MITGDNWSVIAESDEAVLFKINNNVNLDGLELVLKDDCRIMITKVKIEKHEFRVFVNTIKPMFAEVNKGHSNESVKYVKGSGSKTYQ
jgi:hypothetical protein